MIEFSKSSSSYNKPYKTWLYEKIHSSRKKDFCSGKCIQSISKHTCACNCRTGIMPRISSQNNFFGITTSLGFCWNVATLAWVLFRTTNSSNNFRNRPPNSGTNDKSNVYDLNRFVVCVCFNAIHWQFYKFKLFCRVFNSQAVNISNFHVEY